MNRFRVGVDFFHCKSFSGLIFLAEESLSGGLCDLSLRLQIRSLRTAEGSKQPAAVAILLQGGLCFVTKPEEPVRWDAWLEILF